MGLSWAQAWGPADGNVHLVTACWQLSWSVTEPQVVCLGGRWVYLAVSAVIRPGDICMPILSLTIAPGSRNPELSRGGQGQT